MSCRPSNQVVLWNYALCRRAIYFQRLGRPPWFVGMHGTPSEHFHVPNFSRFVWENEDYRMRKRRRRRQIVIPLMFHAPVGSICDVFEEKMTDILRSWLALIQGTFPKASFSKSSTYRNSWRTAPLQVLFEIKIILMELIFNHDNVLPPIRNEIQVRLRLMMLAFDTKIWLKDLISFMPLSWTDPSSCRLYSEASEISFNELLFFHKSMLLYCILLFVLWWISLRVY